MFSEAIRRVGTYLRSCYSRNMGFTIRQSKREDMDSILEVERDAFPEYLQANKEALIERLNLFPEGFLIVENDSEIIGLSTALIIEEVSSASDLNRKPKKLFNEEGDTYYLRSIAVRKSFQGQNVGKKLIETHMANARKRGLKRLVLTSLKSLEGYYEKLGFRKVGGYEETADGVEELLWMKEL